MTYREQITQEQPERVDKASWGEMEGCPPDDQGFKCLRGVPTREGCKECWDREVVVL